LFVDVTASPTVRRPHCWSIAALLAVVATGCAHPRTGATNPPVQTCREVVPNPEPLLQWITPQQVRDRDSLGDWCATVGPVLYRPGPTANTPEIVDRLAIVTWNVHVGSGDVDQLIRRLQGGEYTGGEPVEHFVLLLQEAYRRDGGVPARLARGLPAPARIGSRNPDARGADVDRIAREHRLALLYAPSMRNGGDDGDPEDRGNAIVATLALHAPTIVELPFEHQRRVAAAAVVEGRTRSGTAWRLRVADAHLDTALALTRGGPWAARRRQTAALVDALAAAPEDLVLGGDFNTWFGSREPALKMLRLAFPDAAPDQAATWKGPLGLHASLDYLFARGHALQRVERLPDRLGSDHYPVIGIVRFR
jgi:endonuclease/exonuclease/phosphatase family metal-dependent hydrolase